MGLTHNKYKGKVIIVDGTIKIIGKDITDQAYLVVGGTGFLDGVQCVFTTGEETSFNGLATGQDILVKGEVSGKTMNTVMLLKCRIMQ